MVTVLRPLGDRDSDDRVLAGTLEAPMPGLVVLVNAKSGDSVAKGAVLMVLESMKMELPVLAPHTGIVAELTLVVGDRVELGQPLASVTPTDGPEEP
jgi:biotin carboxyl carrier protein